MPLTADRAKPAVPFAGIYRLIDFALSNVVNSGYLQVVVLTQYKSHSLDRHVTQTWRMSTMLGNYVTPVPAQQRVGKHWYLGSADAIYQSLNLIKRREARHRRGGRRRPRLPDGLLADGRPARRDRRRVHGRGDPAADRAGRPVRRHRRAARRPVADPGVPREAEGPGRPAGQPAARSWPRWATTSSTPTRWSRRSRRDASEVGSKHDMGGDIVPAFVRRNQAGRLRLQGQRRARRDRPRPRLLARRGDDRLLLRRAHGPGLAAAGLQPLQLRLADLHLLRPAAAGEDHAGRGRPARRRRWSPCSRRGSWSAAARSPRSVLSPAAFVGAGAEVTDSVLMNGVRVGAGAVVRNAILDKNVVVPPGAQIGVDPEAGPRARVRRRGRAHGAGQGPAVPGVRRTVPPGGRNSAPA